MPLHQIGGQISPPSFLTGIEPVLQAPIHPKRLLSLCASQRTLGMTLRYYLNPKSSERSTPVCQP
jgi:hypothetical protein